AAALEMAGFGGVFEATQQTRIALTGASMRCDLDGTTLAWNASHILPPGAKLTIGATVAGNYGYLHIGGGFDQPVRLTAQSTHLAAGLGTPIANGMRLRLAPDPKIDDVGFTLPPGDRSAGTKIRVVPGLQTPLFSEGERLRFEKTEFARHMRSNRMGARLVSDGPGFASVAGLSILSEVIVPGDIQMTGDGTPYVLMAECQTTGGYPRIGTVIPSDLPHVAQADQSVRMRFEFITLEKAVEIEREANDALPRLSRQRRRRIKRPEDLRNLLSHELISGVTCGDDLDPEDAPFV
ncbi:MAG: urea amidolyase, partial [Pseudomonadota bacterium]